MIVVRTKRTRRALMVFLGNNPFLDFRKAKRAGLIPHPSIIDDRLRLHDLPELTAYYKERSVA